MKVSGKIVAEAISKKLQIKVSKLEVVPCFAIILAGSDPASRMYVDFKIKAAKKIGIKIKSFEFSENKFNECLKTIKKLNADKGVHGMIVQYPVFKGWDFDHLLSEIDPQKDVDGFHKISPFKGATAMAVWEMLTAFAMIEKFQTTEKFLENKKIIVLGKGRTAGGPIKDLLESRGLSVALISRETENPTQIIKSGDVVIAATGVKNIINKTNLKKGAYVVGVGVGKEVIEGKSKVYGDINEEDVASIAKLYCPTVGGIGPLTIVSLLENVVESASRSAK